MLPGGKTEVICMLTLFLSRYSIHLVSQKINCFICKRFVKFVCFAHIFPLLLEMCCALECPMGLNYTHVTILPLTLISFFFSFDSYVL